MVPKTSPSLQILSKWNQNGTPNRSKINENLDFMKNQKTFKNIVLSSVFEGSTLSKTELFRTGDLQKTIIKQEPSKIHPKLILLSTKIDQGNHHVDFQWILAPKKGAPERTSNSLFSYFFETWGRDASQTPSQSPQDLPNYGFFMILASMFIDFH